MTPKIINIFGSTGSVGCSTLEVIAHANRQADAPIYGVDVLVAGGDSTKLAEQAIQFGAKLAVINDEDRLDDLRARLSGHAIEAAAGEDAIVEAAGRQCHRMVAAIVGIAGLPSTLAALKAGNDVALANKESLICASPLLKQEAERNAAKILPMDSEHSAIFQVLQDRGDVEKLVLTASGGPFLRTPKDELAAMSVEAARAHPQWSMGLKISIDSASMMNKALEVMEAACLFDKTADEIDVVVHPQSIIHSLVSYRDGSVLAQLGSPDMRSPIAYALSWPEKRLSTQVKRLDLAKIGQLDFEPVDDERFPAISLAKQALMAGGAAPLILNSANEAAVAAFIASECRFTDISYIVDRTLERFSNLGFTTYTLLSLDEIAHLHERGTKLAQNLLAELKG